MPRVSLRIEPKRSTVVEEIRDILEELGLRFALWHDSLLFHRPLWKTWSLGHKWRIHPHVRLMFRHFGLWVVFPSSSRAVLSLSMKDMFGSSRQTRSFWLDTVIVPRGSRAEEGK